MVTTYPDYAEARAVADAAAEGGEPYMVCGTQLRDGTPTHFVLPASTPDDQIADLAFEIREGRPVSGAERWAMAVAKRLRGAA